MQYFIQEFRKRYFGHVEIPLYLSDPTAIFIANRILSGYASAEFEKDQELAEEVIELLEKRKGKNESFVGKYAENGFVYIFDPRNGNDWERVPDGKKIKIYAKSLEIR